MPELDLTKTTFGLYESASNGPDRLWTPEPPTTPDGCEGCGDGAPVWFCGTLEHPNFATQDLYCGTCASNMLRKVESVTRPVWFDVDEEGQPAEFYDVQQTEMIFTHQLEELVWKDGCWRVEAYINGFLHYPAAKEYRN